MKLLRMYVFLRVRGQWVWILLFEFEVCVWEEASFEDSFSTYKRPTYLPPSKLKAGGETHQKKKSSVFSGIMKNIFGWWLWWKNYCIENNFLKEIFNKTKWVVNYDDKTIFPSHLLITFTSFSDKNLTQHGKCNNVMYQIYIMYLSICIT